jgi:phage anti-repressor protein
MNSQRLDIVHLIHNSPMTHLTRDFQHKLLEKIQQSFTDDQQQLFVASFYTYLNYNSKTDFVIDLDNVWKWLGFSRKEHCKTALVKHFTKDIDYKVALPQIRERKNEGGFNKEQVMLNIETFKGLCMLAGTKKSKEIRQYYLKLEELLQETMKEESEILKSQLEEKNKLIEEMEMQPETEGFQNRESGEIYCIRDNSKNGHFKIGVANKSITRVDQLNVGSSTHSLQLYIKFDTFDRILAEKLIHQALNPFRIKNRKDESIRFDSFAWFYFRNDLELAYAIRTMKQSLDFINQFDITSYAHFKEVTLNLKIDDELVKTDVLEQLQKEEEVKAIEYKDNVKKKNINNLHQMKHRSGTFKGASWCNEKQLWKSQLQHNYDNVHLGYFTDEIDAAKVYNDYALYLNNNENTNFLLNEIPGYISIPRNVPDENKTMIQEKKSSKYNGVSYDSNRKYYVCGIRFTGKTYNLGNHQSEIECAKLYNQQAMYFNTKFNTQYVLNDIPDYVTLPKDIFSELNSKKVSNKSSKYHGVSLTKQNKWACSYTMNKKKIHIGTYNTELEACLAYNDAVIELNKNGCNYRINVI